MQRLKAIKEPEPNRMHDIEGTWGTREVRINGNRITVDMVIERMNDFFLLDKGEVTAFAWGPDAPRKEVFALAYGCTEFTVPETWVHTFDSHAALDDFFVECLKALSRTDFTLHFTDVELRRAMRRIKHQWRTGVRKMLMS